MKRQKQYIPAVISLLIAALILAFVFWPEKEEPLPAGEEPPPPVVVTPPPAEPPARTRYRMDLTLDVDAKTIGGLFRITVLNDSADDWDTLCLRDYNAGAIAYFREDESFRGALPQSVIHAITDYETGGALAWERDESDETVVYVSLARPLAPGESMTVLIDYTTGILQDDFFLSWSYAGEENILFEIGNFYPVLALYENGGWSAPPYYYGVESFFSKCADYEVSLALPEDYLAVSSGRETKLSRADGMVLWRLTAENIRDFAITAGNDLACFSDTAADGTRINSYFFTREPGGLDTRGEAMAMLREGIKAFDMYSSLIGPYPYEELDIVVSLGEYGGLEYPALMRVSNAMRRYLSGAELSEERLAERLAALTDIAAHEIAHQWFFAVVGNDSYREAWLDEAFANFLENCVYRRAYMSGEEIEELMGAFRRRAARVGSLEWEFLDIPATDQEYYYLNVYERGCVFLYDLMMTMGEGLFFEMLRDYYGAYSFGEAHTADFVDTLRSYASGNVIVWELVDAHLRER